MCCNDDSDMKIMSGKVSKQFDLAEGAATAFNRERANGNLERARTLGRKFAADLFENDGKALFGVGAFDDEKTIIQRRVLFAYVVNRVIEDLAPNSIVAQSALSVFYDTLQKASEQYYQESTDAAAFSQYILAVRSTSDDPCAIGNVFARLCGRGADKVFVKYGCELADFFTLYCTQAVLSAQFA